VKISEGDCVACGKTVRYCGYVPRIYLCTDCGGERPHGEGVVERDGRLYYEPDSDETAGKTSTETEQSSTETDQRGTEDGC